MVLKQEGFKVTKEYVKTYAKNQKILVDKIVAEAIAAPI